MGWGTTDVGEIAATAAANPNLFAKYGSMV
jgi:hypothetical protein